MPAPSLSQDAGHLTAIFSVLGNRDVIVDIIYIYLVFIFWYTTPWAKKVVRRKEFL